MGGLTGLTGGGLPCACGEEARGEVDGCGAGISMTRTGGLPCACGEEARGDEVDGCGAGI